MSAIRAAITSLGRGHDRRQLNEQARDDLRLIRHLTATAVWVTGCAGAITIGASLVVRAL